jgi:ubiquinone/menaquinone biosynthesis C-methylase UbiE
LRSHRWRTAENSAAFLLPHLSNGLSILDVGCGPGNITAELASRVGSGEVIGIDVAAEVIAVAKSEFESSERENLSFSVGDVYELGFSEGRFDVVYAHQVLQHLSDPVAALAEMRRVLKPGGLLAVRDADYGALVWSPEDPVLTHWLDVYHQITVRNHADADAGRHLATWVRAAGYDEIEVSTSKWTFQTPQERAWWGGLWADRVRLSEFARQAIEYGVASDEELALIAEAFQRWANDPEGVFVVVHGEVLARR